jgi:hypothetical protein
MSRLAASRTVHTEGHCKEHTTQKQQWCVRILAVSSGRLECSGKGVHPQKTAVRLAEAELGVIGPMRKDPEPTKEFELNLQVNEMTYKGKKSVHHRLPLK